MIFARRRADGTVIIERMDSMRTRFRITPLVAVLAALTACEKPKDAKQADSSSGDRRVVLYTSCDDYLLRDMIAAFEKETGIDVLEVGDTEATKTVGLYTRLVSEKDQPRADVWWSNEPFYTVRLAQQGVLEPYTSAAGERAFPAGWPGEFRGTGDTWYGFAQRARVIAYDTRKHTPESVPGTLRDLAEPQWKGKVGMARPLFGTTVGHIATLISLWGEEPTRQWLQAMEDQGLRLYDGNSAVVRAIANGEIEIGLTDSDDVWAAQAQDLPIGLVYESNEIEGSLAPTPESVHPMMSFGALIIPNTAAVVRGAPHPAEARALVDFLISEASERLIMTSDSRNVPVRASAARELFVLFPESQIQPGAHVNLEEVAGNIETARRLVEDVFGG